MERIALQQSSAGGNDQMSSKEDTTRTNKRRAILGSLALILVCIIWGSSFTIGKVAMEEAHPMALIAVRFVIATVVLLLLSIPRLKKLNMKIIGSGLILAIPLYLAFYTQFAGLRLTSASNTGFITGMYVIFTPILSAIFLKKKPTILITLGILAATIGLALLSLKSDFTLSSGDLLVLLCALMYAVHIVLLNVFSPKMDGMLLTLTQMFWVSIIACIVGFRHLPEAVTYSNGTLLSIVFLGVGGSAFAYYVQTTAQKYTSPTSTSIIFQLEVVFAAIFAYIFLNEVMTTRQWVGAGSIFIGILLCQLNDVRSVKTE